MGWLYIADLSIYLTKKEKTMGSLIFGSTTTTFSGPGDRVVPGVIPLQAPVGFWQQEEIGEPLLRLVKQIMRPARENVFYPVGHFREDEHFSLLSPNFRLWCSQPEPAAPARELRFSRQLQPALTKQLVTELGGVGKMETYLIDLYRLAMHPKGARLLSKGVLLFTVEQATGLTRLLQVVGGLQERLEIRAHPLDLVEDQLWRKGHIVLSTHLQS